MNSPEAIDQFYTVMLEPQLAELEARRRRIVGLESLCKVVAVLLPLMVIALLVGGVMLFGDLVNDFITGIAAGGMTSPVLARIAVVGGLPLIGAMGVVFVLRRLRRSVIRGREALFRSYKEEIIGDIITFLGPGFRYDHAVGHDDSWLVHSGLFRREYHRYTAEDFVSGKVGDTSIEFSEIRVYKDQRELELDLDREGLLLSCPTITYTLFKGVVFIADLGLLCDIVEDLGLNTRIWDR